MNKRDFNRYQGRRPLSFVGIVVGAALLLVVVLTFAMWAQALLRMLQ